MSDIKKKQSHNMDLDVLRSRLKDLADEMKTKFGVKSQWEGDTCHLSGSAVKNGFLSFDEKEISLELTLGMMGKMLKGPIEKEMDTRIAKILKA